MVVVAYCDYTHIVILRNKRLQEGIFVRIHILGFVDYHHRFGDTPGFCFALLNIGHGLLHDIVRFLFISNPSEQVKTISVKGVYFHEVSGIANKFYQPGLKFRSRCTRKCEHQQLLVFYIFQQQEGSQLVHQNAGFAAARTGGHDHVFGIFVFYNAQLTGRELAKQLFEFGRCDILPDLISAAARKVFGEK